MLVPLRGLRENKTLLFIREVEVHIYSHLSVSKLFSFYFEYIHII